MLAAIFVAIHIDPEVIETNPTLISSFFHPYRDCGTLSKPAR